MKKYLLMIVLLSVAGTAQALPVHYFGELTGSGNYQGSVTSPDAWANPTFALNQNSQQVNLWGLNARAGQNLSLAVNGLDGLMGGFSLYYGEITNNDLLFSLFNNSGNTGNANYLTGTTTFGSDSALSDITLNNSGFYTLVVGGKGFGWNDEYRYNLDVTTASVPETGSLLLLGTGLLGMAVLRRRQHKRDQTLSA